MENPWLMFVTCLGRMQIKTQFKRLVVGTLWFYVIVKKQFRANDVCNGWQTRTVNVFYTILQRGMWKVE